MKNLIDDSFMVRIKTKEEMIRDRLLDLTRGLPLGWVSEMEHLFGETVRIVSSSESSNLYIIITEGRTWVTHQDEIASGLVEHSQEGIKDILNL